MPHQYTRRFSRTIFSFHAPFRFSALPALPYACRFSGYFSVSMRLSDFPLCLRCHTPAGFLGQFSVSIRLSDFPLCLRFRTPVGFSGYFSVSMRLSDFPLCLRYHTPVGFLHCSQSLNTYRIFARDSSDRIFLILSIKSTVAVVADKKSDTGSAQ